jgi:hypothetical protein
MKQQRKIFFLLIALYVMAAIAYFFVPGGAMDISSQFGVEDSGMPNVPTWQLALANAGIIFVVYSLIGLLGLWLARKIDLPGVFRPGATFREWFIRPLIVGAIGGVFLVVIDRLISRYGDFGGFPHPVFPGSILASLTAGIGEEIVFRLFVMSLWAVILNWLLGKLFRKRDTRPWALWSANIIAALAFAAGHLGSAMFIFDVTNPLDLPALVLLMIFALNGLVGILTGWLFIADGLIAAASVHFWVDIVWHVIYGLFQ